MTATTPMSIARRCVSIENFLIMSGLDELITRLINRPIMQITKMVGSHCDDTHTAFRTEPPLTREVLDCAISNYFPSGWGDMFSTQNGLLIVARVGIPNSMVQDYARYLTSAERKVGQAADGRGSETTGQLATASG